MTWSVFADNLWHLRSLAVFSVGRESVVLLEDTSTKREMGLLLADLLTGMRLKLAPTVTCNAFFSSDG